MSSRAQRSAAGCRLELEPPDARLGRQVPELDGRVLAGRDQPGSIGAPGDVENRRGVAGEDGDQSARGGVPDIDRVIKAAGREPGSVGTERDRIDAARGRVKFANLATRGGVPDTYHPIGSPGGDQRSIGMKCHTANLVTGPREHDVRCAAVAGQVPDAGGPVLAGRGEPGPIGTERDAEDSARVAAQDLARRRPAPGRCRARADIPDPDRSILAGRRELAAVAAKGDAGGPAFMTDGRREAACPRVMSQTFTWPSEPAVAMRIPARSRATP